MKRIICNEDFSEKFSFDGKQIHIPTRYIDIAKRTSRPVLRKVEDVDGNVLLKPTYLPSYAEEELFRYLPSFGLKVVNTIASIPNVWVVDYLSDKPIVSSTQLSKIDNIEMIVEGEAGEVSVGLSVNYTDGTFKTIYNNLIPFPEYEVISLIELEFDDTATVFTMPDEEESEEPSTQVFRDMTNDDIDAIIDAFNSAMGAALSESPDANADDNFYFHITIRNGKWVFD